MKHATALGKSAGKFHRLTMVLFGVVDLKKKKKETRSHAFRKAKPLWVFFECFEQFLGHHVCSHSWEPGEWRSCSSRTFSSFSGPLYRINNSTTDPPFFHSLPSYTSSTEIHLIVRLWVVFFLVSYCSIVVVSHMRAILVTSVVMWNKNIGIVHLVSLHHISQKSS